MPYYLYSNNQVSGPYKLDDVQSLKGDPDTLICEEEAGLPDGRWHFIRDLIGPEFSPINSLINEGQSFEEEFDELKWAASFFKKESEKRKDRFSRIGEKTKEVSFDCPETFLFQTESQKREPPSAPAVPLEAREGPNLSDLEEIKRHLKTLEEKFELLKDIGQAKASLSLGEESPTILAPKPPVIASPLAVQMPSPPIPQAESVRLDLNPIASPLPHEMESSFQEKETNVPQAFEINEKVEEVPVAVAPIPQEAENQDASGEDIRFQMGKSWDSPEESSGEELQIQMGDSFEAVDEAPQEKQDLTLHSPEAMPQEAFVAQVETVADASVEIAQAPPPIEVESPASQISGLELTPAATPVQETPTFAAPETPAMPSQAQDLSAPAASEIPLPAPAVENPVQNPSETGGASFVFPTINQNPENPAPTVSAPSSGNLESLIQVSSPADTVSPAQFSPQSFASESGSQIMIESSLQTAQGGSAEPLITPIFNQPNSPSAFLGAASEGAGLQSPLEVGAPSPFQTSPGAQELLDRFSKPDKPDSPAPEKNQAKKAAKKSRSRLLPIVGLGAIVLAGVSFFLFFRNPKDLSNMLSPGATQRPLGMEPASQAAPQASATQSLPMPTTASPAPSAQTESSAPVSTGQENPASNPSATPSQSLSSPLPKSSKEPQTPRTLTPSEQAINLVKQYPLEGPKANVGKWLDYAFGADSDAKEEWSAGKLSKGVYLVRYRVTFGSSSKRKAVVYLFQSDISGEMVLGDNGAARRLLSGEAPKVHR